MADDALRKSSTPMPPFDDGPDVPSHRDEAGRRHSPHRVEEAHGKYSFDSSPPCALPKDGKVWLSNTAQHRDEPRSLAQAVVVCSPKQQLEPVAIQWTQEGRPSGFFAIALVTACLVSDCDTGLAYADCMTVQTSRVRPNGEGNDIAGVVACHRIGGSRFNDSIRLEILMQISRDLQGQVRCGCGTWVLNNEGALATKYGCHRA